MTSKAGILPMSGIALAASACLALLHPTIGVRDVDAYAYVTGAMSLRAGHGYVDLLGQRLNHWPPGYSWLLSWFPQPTRAAAWLNDLGFGVAVSALWRVAVLAGWEVKAASGMAIAVGMGFLRGVATNAAPDILIYAAFLLTLPSVAGLVRAWWAPHTIWAAAIPVKLIAMTFGPAAVVAAAISRRPLTGRQTAAAGLVWLIAVGGILTFNRLTMGVFVPDSHEHASVSGVLAFVKLMTIDIGRDGLAFWYGSIRDWRVLAAFGSVATVGLWCLTSLRRSSDARGLVPFGLCCMVVAVCLAGVRDYSGGWRLTGYGFLALLPGLVPKAGATPRWLAYGTISAALALWNVAAVNSMGANNPRYAALAQSAAKFVEGSVATNSFHLLDLHAAVASRPVHDWAEVSETTVLRVDLPSFDGVATSSWPMAGAAVGWCTVARLDGGDVLRRCAVDRR
jgi:hypothetical protein